MAPLAAVLTTGKFAYAFWPAAISFADEDGPVATRLPSGILRKNWNDTTKISMAPRKDDARKSRSVSNCLSVPKAFCCSIECRTLGEVGKELRVNEMIADTQMK